MGKCTHSIVMFVNDIKLFVECSWKPVLPDSVTTYPFSVLSLLLWSVSFKVFVYSYFYFGVAHSFASFTSFTPVCISLFLSDLQLPSFISLFCPFPFTVSVSLHLLSVVSIKMLWHWWTLEPHNDRLLCSATVPAHSDQYARWARLIHVQLCRFVSPVRVDAPNSLRLV
jgi:hypothetical protein